MELFTLKEVYQSLGVSRRVIQGYEQWDLVHACGKNKYGYLLYDAAAVEIQDAFPGIKGFNRRGLYRMKQFYETYKDNEIVSPLVTQISWTNHLLILSGCKSNEEREFYMRLCIRENYSKRQS